MLDVRLSQFVVPVAEQLLAAITPVVRAQNVADEPASVQGIVRIYRVSTGLMVYDSNLTPTSLAAGAQADIAAMTPFSPGAPADDDYFIIAEIRAVTSSPAGWHNCESRLPAMYFDIKPAPLGDIPDSHAPTHENAGMDEIDLSGLSGLLADPQTPASHAASHIAAGTDLVESLPVGSIYLTTSADNPAVTLGFGFWSPEPPLGGYNTWLRSA